MVVMGVSGAGKSTVGRLLAGRLGWEFAEGDDLHPPANVRKMAAGEALTDSDRWPWLEAVASWIDGELRSGRSGVITCSALKRSYREVLVGDRTDVYFCHVQADPELIRERVEAREGHYMPSSLLPSQLATLEPLAPDERGFVVSAEDGPDDVLHEALQKLERENEGEPT